jgi:dihydropyrimidinase
MPLDLAVVGGLVAGTLAGGIRKIDIGVADGKIAGVAERGRLGKAARTIEADGLYVLPGVLDVHTHFDAEMFGERTADDFESGSDAAAAGGVTTIVDYAFQAPGKSLREGVSRWHRKAAGRSKIDYGFHIAVLDPTADAIAEVPSLVRDGYASFKVFMMRDFEARALDFLRFFRVAGQSEALLAIHAEDQNIIDYCTERLYADGNRGVDHFAASRPPSAETVAAARAIAMAWAANAYAYLVHLSSAGALDEVRRARAGGNQVLAETRPLYLYLSENRYHGPSGELYVGYPPLRAECDVTALWDGLIDGTIDTVASDHCSWCAAKKTSPLGFARMRPGMSNVETLLPMLYSEGVGGGKFGLERLVELICSNPAKIFGLYPRKGVIGAGSDADLVLVDPKAEVTVRATQLHSRADYDPFEGWRVRGWPTATISRGEVIAKDRKVTAEPGRGQFIARARFNPRWRDRSSGR